MLRILRAFAWMRWRVLVNSLERTGARDTLQRLSLAVEQLGPLLAAALFIPSALGLAALSGYTGYALGSSPAGDGVMFELLRYLLLAAVGLSVVGPIMLPATERTNAVRLLLLPIPHSVLYAAQAATAITDPWNLLVVPVVAAFPIGLALAGAPGPALIAFLAGVLLLVILLGLSSLTTLVLHLLMRDRRRGELLALLFVVVLPLIVVLPGMLESGTGRTSSRRVDRPAAGAPGTGRGIPSRAFALVPSELFRRAVAGSVRSSHATSIPGLLGLAMTALGLHGLGLAASNRMLGSPATGGPRRASTGGARPGVKLPGISRAASAVAINQLRLAFRTSRGRSILVTPLAVFAMFVLLMRRSGALDMGFTELQSGLGLAFVASGVCLLAILPFAMNQFAVDRAGLTLQFLSPLSDLDLLIGKATGNGLIAGLPALACVLLAFLIFPGGGAAMWLSIPPGFVATYAAAAPAAAAASAVFPRAVDLNSISSRSNAHGLAGVLGMLAVAAAAVPSILLMLVAVEVFGQPALAPVLLLVWCVVSLVLCRALLSVVARLLQKRRENLALVV